MWPRYFISRLPREGFSRVPSPLPRVNDGRFIYRRFRCLWLRAGGIIRAPPPFLPPTTRKGSARWAKIPFSHIIFIISLVLQFESIYYHCHCSCIRAAFVVQSWSKSSIRRERKRRILPSRHIARTAGERNLYTYVCT